MFYDSLHKMFAQAEHYNVGEQLFDCTVTTRNTYFFNLNLLDSNSKLQIFIDVNVDCNIAVAIIYEHKSDKGRKFKTKIIFHLLLHTHMHAI